MKAKQIIIPILSLTLVTGLTTGCTVTEQALAAVTTIQTDRQTEKLHKLFTEVFSTYENSNTVEYDIINDFDNYIADEIAHLETVIKETNFKIKNDLDLKQAYTNWRKQTPEYKVSYLAQLYNEAYKSAILQDNYEFKDNTKTWELKYPTITAQIEYELSVLSNILTTGTANPTENTVADTKHLTELGINVNNQAELSEFAQDIEESYKAWRENTLEYERIFYDVYKSTANTNSTVTPEQLEAEVKAVVDKLGEYNAPAGMKQVQALENSGNTTSTNIIQETLPIPANIQAQYTNWRAYYQSLEGIFNSVYQAHSNKSVDEQFTEIRREANKLVASKTDPSKKVTNLELRGDYQQHYRNWKDDKVKAETAAEENRKAAEAAEQLLSGGRGKQLAQQVMANYGGNTGSGGNGNTGGQKQTQQVTPPSAGSGGFTVDNGSPGTGKYAGMRRTGVAGFEGENNSTATQTEINNQSDLYY